MLWVKLGNSILASTRTIFAVKDSALWSTLKMMSLSPVPELRRISTTVGECAHSRFWLVATPEPEIPMMVLRGQVKLKEMSAVSTWL